MPEKIVYLKAKCPVCNREFTYIEGGYVPHTCKDINCLHRYLHDPQYQGKNHEGVKTMIFCCFYCPATFPQTTLLFRHYTKDHPEQKLTTYKIKHLPSGERGMASAPNQAQACLRLCWDIKDCKVEEFRGF